ncbi:MAG TPA: class I SAM-dependent methyltransferase [Polyangiales bacterium]|nr:class I SAM-dependent methyltransferase [Polyangiales bacterium]
MSPALSPLKTLVKNVADPLFWRLSRAELKRMLADHPSTAADDITTITRSYRGRGWYKVLAPYQVDEEFRQLAEWAAAQRPKVVVEIGTASGGTLLMWSRIVQRRVISVDLPGGIHGGGYPERKARLFREFVRDRPGIQLDLICASSQDVATRDRVARLLGSERIDILFIDGDHRLAGVSRDYELWRELVAPGGHIVFHDIVPNTRVPTSQVDVFWRQLRSQHPDRTREIVAARDQGWAGIGILSV